MGTGWHALVRAAPGLGYWLIALKVVHSHDLQNASKCILPAPCGQQILHSLVIHPHKLSLHGMICWPRLSTTLQPGI